MFLSDKLIWSAALRCLAVIVPVALALADETPVTDCDGLAAHPADPHRVSNGVVFDQVDAQTAIRKCQQAVEQFPGSPRLIFQLGRAHDANEESAQALKL